MARLVRNAVSGVSTGSERNNKYIAIHPIMDGSQNEGIDVLDVAFDARPQKPIFGASRNVFLRAEPSPPTIHNDERRISPTPVPSQEVEAEHAGYNIFNTITEPQEMESNGPRDLKRKRKATSKTMVNASPQGPYSRRREDESAERVIHGTLERTAKAKKAVRRKGKRSSIKKQCEMANQDEPPRPRLMLRVETHRPASGNQVTLQQPLSLQGLKRKTHEAGFRGEAFHASASSPYAPDMQRRKHTAQPFRLTTLIKILSLSKLGIACREEPTLRKPMTGPLRTPAKCLGKKRFPHEPPIHPHPLQLTECSARRGGVGARMALTRPPLRSICVPPADGPSALSRINTIVAATDLSTDIASDLHRDVKEGQVDDLCYDADHVPAIAIDNESSRNSGFTDADNCQNSAPPLPNDRGDVGERPQRFPFNFTASEARPHVIKPRPKRWLDYRVQNVPGVCQDQPSPIDSRPLAPILSEQVYTPMLKVIACSLVPPVQSHTEASETANTLIRKLTTEQLAERYKSLGAPLRQHRTHRSHLIEAADELPHSGARLGLNDSRGTKEKVLILPQSTPLNVPSSVSSTPPMPCGQRPKHSMPTAALYVHPGRTKSKLVTGISQPLTLPTRAKSVRFSDISSPCPIRTKVDPPLERNKSYMTPPRFDLMQNLPQTSGARQAMKRPIVSSLTERQHPAQPSLQARPPSRGGQTLGVRRGNSVSFSAFKAPTMQLKSHGG